MKCSLQVSKGCTTILNESSSPEIDMITVYNFSKRKKLIQYYKKSLHNIT